VRPFVLRGAAAPGDHGHLVDVGRARGGAPGARDLRGLAAAPRL